MMATPFTESESDLGVGATKRKRKKRRSPGGLGRGLARILTDSNAAPSRSATADSGLLQLVGGESSAKATKVRKFVVDTALSALADAFALDGLILATHSPDEQQQLERLNELGETTKSPPMFLAATLPPSWSLDSQILFEVYGNLWRVLKDDESDAAQVEGTVPLSNAISRQWQTAIGQHQVWMARMDDGQQPVAVVAIRPDPFTPPETEALAAVIGSVVAACSENEAKLTARHAIREGTSVSLKSEGADVLAEVSADWQLSGQVATGATARRNGAGRDVDPVAAVARAAAKACRPRCEITFAGASDLDDSQVSVVMIRDAQHGLRLGFAVRPHGDYSGAAEAVFTAASSSQTV